MVTVSGWHATSELRKHTISWQAALLRVQHATRRRARRTMTPCHEKTANRSRRFPRSQATLVKTVKLLAQYLGNDLVAVSAQERTSNA